MLKCQYEVHRSKNDTYSMDSAHFHDDTEIIFCTQGEGVLFLGQDVFSLHRGSLFVIDAFQLHRSVANEEYRCSVFHISPDMLEAWSTWQTNYYSKVHSNLYLAADLTEKDVLYLEALYKPLYDDCSNGFGGDVEQIINVLKFLNTAFSHFNSGNILTTHSNPKLEKILPILNYIQDHLEEKISTDMLSKMFYMNKFYLCRLFKDGTGFSVIDYVINCRILKARALLRRGLSVQEAGEQSGFNSNEHFIRTFKKTTGITPKQYALQYAVADQRTKELVSIEGKSGKVTSRSY